MPHARKKSEPSNAGTLDDLLNENLILAGASEHAQSVVREHGTLVAVALRQKIYDPEEEIEQVYFPIDCVLSVIAMMRDGNQIEIGTVGREGMSAFPLLLGATTTSNISYCQVRGRAIRLPTPVFQQLLEDDPSIRQLLDRYLQAYVNMLGQLAACNRLHTIYERCARWLLLTRDRVSTDKIELTQEFLAMMLGTGRSGVTIAASTLQQAGFIQYTHGIIQITDRAGLETATCECYEIARDQFTGLLRSVPGADAAVPAAEESPFPAI